MKKKLICLTLLIMAGLTLTSCSTKVLNLEKGKEVIIRCSDLIKEVYEGEALYDENDGKANAQIKLNKDHCK